ncbi:MAG: DUF2268 domain-containing protein [bacterium]|nr:DUF2268 domain-containing protein [bacterium]
MTTHRLLAALIALVLSLGAVAQDVSWLLVRSDAESGSKSGRTLATFGWEKLAKVYLKRSYRIVDADAADSIPAASRLVAGTPTNNAAVARLAQALGITFSERQVSYQGRTFPVDAGLALVRPDPDGGGTLALFCGATERAVFHCISVPVDLRRPGWVAMTFQKTVARGEIADPLRVAADELRLVRLDEDLFRIRSAWRHSSDEAALRVSRAFAGYQSIFDGAVRRGVDLFAYTRNQFATQGAMLDRVHERFTSVDLRAVIEELDDRVAGALGGRTGPRPIVHVVVTQPDATNAQVIGRDEVTGRMRMTLNLAAFDDVSALKLAVAHELVHTLQGSHDGTLLGRCIHEGVASYVSQQLLEGTSDHAALMWPREKLAAAKKRDAKILAAFRRLADSRDMRRIGDFYYAGSPLRSVPGAPDRSGYYVGWRAVASWHAANRDRPLKDLLRVPPAEFLAALD